MRSVSVFVPGSTMLFGEHAVLRGAWGLRAALDQGLRVAILPRHDQRIRIHSGVGQHEGQVDNLGYHPQLTYVLAALEKRQRTFSHGLDIIIKSDLGRMGWGSSAAVVSGVLAALTLAQGNPDFDKEILYHEGLQVIHGVTGGIGSGADLAASLYGGIVGIKPAEKKIATWPADIPLTLIYSGYKTPTAQVVQQVQANAAREPDRYEAIFRRMRVLSGQAVEAVKQQDWKALGKLFTHYYACQKDLGVSDGVLNTLVQALMADSGIHGAKIAGAGLGDCAIALGHGDACLENSFQVRVDPQGIREVALGPPDIIAHITGFFHMAKKTEVEAFAPVNIALVKYWGKRDAHLNLPMTDSLSVTLPWGTRTRLSKSLLNCDVIVLNGTEQDMATSFYQSTVKVLDFFRPRPDFFYRLETVNDLPTAAGLASSASGLAALTLTLNDFWGWNLEVSQLSIIARMLSGSACRSVFGSRGFVHWQKGDRTDGLDSVGVLLADEWPGLCLGIVTVTTAVKDISSRAGMTESQASPKYASWPNQVTKNLAEVLSALGRRDFNALGEAVEENALAMHCTTIPENAYFLPKTWMVLETVHHLRQQGIPVYATMDAGPNVKILFEENPATILALEKAFGTKFMWAKVM